jgi:hypothetical protein
VGAYCGQSGGGNGRKVYPNELLVRLLKGKTTNVSWERFNIPSIFFALRNSIIIILPFLFRGSEKQEIKEKKKKEG